MTCNCGGGTARAALDVARTCMRLSQYRFCFSVARCPSARARARARADHFNRYGGTPGTSHRRDSTEATRIASTSGPKSPQISRHDFETGPPVLQNFESGTRKPGVNPNGATKVGLEP